jgi:fatty acid desaturase
MEPIDTDFEYVASKSQEADPRKRFNWMYIIPVLGLLWLLYLTLAIIFEWPVTGVVDPVMTIMIVVFFVFVGLLFWALAPRAKQV